MTARILPYNSLYETLSCKKRWILQSSISALNKSSYHSSNNSSKEQTESFKVKYKKSNWSMSSGLVKSSPRAAASKPTNSSSSNTSTAPIVSHQQHQNYSIFVEAFNPVSTNQYDENVATTTSNSISNSQQTSNLFSKKRSDQSESRERLNHIRIFYADPEIDKAADKPLIRLNPMTMMYMGFSEDNSHLLKSANYLRNEVPIRIAHLIKELRHLPFIVAVNPSMLDIHERCIKAFRQFDNFDKEIKDINAEKRFNQIVCDMLDLNKDLLALLCDGFRDTRRYINNEEFIKSNLNRILSARLGIRLLCEHHIALNKQSSLNQILLSNDLNDTSNKMGMCIDDTINSNNNNNNNNHSPKDEEWVGIIHKKFSPKRIIENSGRMVTKICTEKYGIAPKLKIDGHTNAQFPYLPLPLDYIIPELLKNSFRATCEHHRGSQVLPDVNVTIAINEKECIFRIRDRGGGVPRLHCEKIFDYHFSTGGSNPINLVDSASTDSSLSTGPAIVNDNDFLGNAVVGMICEASSTRGLAVMHGYGFGLPTSKAYAEYLGGTLAFQSMQGIGSDFYLKLPLLDTEPEMVRI